MTGTPPFLTRADLAQERTPAELFTWMNAKCEELGGTPEAKKFARSGDHLAKKFYDEVRPLALFAWREFGDRSDVSVTPDLGIDNFDGTIFFGGRPRLFIEITYAKDGHKDSLRMEVLSREGHVNVLAQSVWLALDYSPNRRVEIPNVAVRRDGTVAKHLADVASCMAGKANVSYGPQHVLVIVVDDYIPFRDSRDVQTLESLVACLLLSLSPNFGRLVILGASGQLFISKLLPL